MADRSLALALAGAATVFYFLLAVGLFLPDGTVLIGTKIYDYYFLALTEGRFDVPLRVAAREGHYDSEANAFIYHGLAPVLTRLAAWPFVDLKEASHLPNLTVWLFAALGSAAYHLTLFQVVARYGPAGRSGLIWQAVVALMAWLCSPGLLLAANHAFFHEPTVVAYFCTAWSVYFYARVILHGVAPGRVLIPLALLAGLSVFARPNVALALYLGVGLLMLSHLWQTRATRLAPVVMATAILGIFGSGLLAFNAARFGDPLTMSGSNEEAEVEYGFSYWSTADIPINAARLEAFREHGTFNAKRILPNLMMYAVDLPWGHFVGQPKDLDIGPIGDLYRAWTLDRLGFIRIEGPRVGFLYIWLPWLVLAGLGLRGPGPGTRDQTETARRAYSRGWFALVALGAMALLILSYGTITLRYRFEVFPLLAILGILALPRLLQRHRARPGWNHPSLILLGGATAGAALVSSGVTVFYADQFKTSNGRATLSYETCETMVLEKGFGTEDLARICRL